MSTGDAADVLARIESTLPPWWGDTHPVLDSIIAGWAFGGAANYTAYTYAKAQTRIATASDDWLDMVAYDFTGFQVVRNTGESDDAFRARILAFLVRRLVTRPAIAAALEALCGSAPIIVEPWRPADTGGYSQPGFGYSRAGNWGSRLLPCQSFIVQHYSTPVTPADIYGLLNSSKAEGTRIWVRVVTP